MPNSAHEGAPPTKLRKRSTPDVTEKPLASLKLNPVEPAGFLQTKQHDRRHDHPVRFALLEQRADGCGLETAAIATSPPKKIAGPQTQDIGALCIIGFGV